MLVQYKGKNLYNFTDQFRLIPGINDVEDSLVQKALKHPIFSKRVEAGQIVIINAKKADDGKMSIAEMRKLIPNMFDKRLLEKIISEDSREEVKRLASEQLDKIKHPSAGVKKSSSLDEVEHFGGSKGE